jgi:hypothetical protein
MNAGFASRLVRGWVSVYTRGLPPEVRLDRRDEIDSDLWSQHEEAGSTGRWQASLTVEILARLVLGIAADVAWRLEQGRIADRSVERSTDVGTRIVALLAIIGGLCMSVAAIPFVAAMLTHPSLHPWDVTYDGSASGLGLASLVVLSLALGGIGFVLAYRYDSPMGMVAEVGAVGGILAVFGGYVGIFVLPLASALVVLSLARIHAVRLSIALIHAAAAAAFVLPLALMINNTPVGLAAIFVLAYPVTWVGLGVEFLGGLPAARPTTRSVS